MIVYVVKLSTFFPLVIEEMFKLAVYFSMINLKSDSGA